MSIELFADSNEPIPGTTLYRRFRIENGLQGEEVLPYSKAKTERQAILEASNHGYLFFWYNGSMYHKLALNWYRLVPVK